MHIRSKRLFPVAIAFSFVGCTSEESTEVTQLVVASVGGTISTPNGSVLEIPPGALSEDTEVTVLEESFEDPDNQGYFGLRFEPDGLELSPLESASSWACASAFGTSTWPCASSSSLELSFAAASSSPFFPSSFAPSMVSSPSVSLTSL